MIMQTLERTNDRAGPAAGTVDSTGIPDRSGSDGAVARFVARLLDVAENSVVGASYPAARRRILQHLQVYGPRPIAGLPREWPVTAQHLPNLVRELEQDGLVERESRPAGVTRYRLSPDGAAALAATRGTQLALIATLLRAAADGDDRTAEGAYSRLRAALGNPDGEP